MDASISLFELGWQTYFQQQLSLEDLESNHVARVCHADKSGYGLIKESGLASLSSNAALPNMTIGDWIVLDESGQFVRKLDRSALFSDDKDQLIAANVDTVFIVSALDDSFNLELIKRYLELIHEAEADAVVVLTKADLCADTDAKREQIQQLDPLLLIETVNAKSDEPLQALNGLFRKGKTVAILGAPGSGKSRLVRSLITVEESHFGVQQDALFQLPNGAVLLDSPALRELQANEAELTNASGFDVIARIAAKCRFNDCTHTNEPGCAVRKAIEAGDIEAQHVNAFKRSSYGMNDGADYKSKPQDKFHRSANSDARARKHSASDA
ncbi:GTPase RsgA [Marinomonas ostreistagni]|uniref:GTPase RsgA n=1 Tax=Marinomonas ostreistagni TaxID=359209 RepID=UPI001950C949|nr:GTPase RsgA [Marinomonas ostreistagni]MBM6551750.1 GTPase RsgA [Marinomonas ostreistagni]